MQDVQKIDVRTFIDSCFYTGFYQFEDAWRQCGTIDLAQTGRGDGECLAF